MSYDPAYYAPHVNALNYANTVTATFENNFPGMFGFAESEEKAHALLACALAHQSRSTLNRIATAMNYVGSSVLSLLDSVVGRPAVIVPGLSPVVAQQIADEFVAVAFPIAQSLNAQLENVAGQPGTFFSAPDTWSGDWEIAEMSGAFNQFYLQVQTIANLDRSVVSADSSANIVYVAVANELLRRLDQVKVALDYLNTKDGFLGDAFTRSQMLSTLTDGPFGGFVNLYDIDRDAAIEFATAFVNIMLNVVEEQVGVLEESRAAYAQAVASAGAAAQAEALRPRRRGGSERQECGDCSERRDLLLERKPADHLRPARHLHAAGPSDRSVPSLLDRVRLHEQRLPHHRAHPRVRMDVLADPRSASD